LDSSAKAGENRMQEMDGTSDGLLHLWVTVASQEITECLYSLFKKGSNRLDIVACSELCGELIFDEACPYLCFVLLNGIVQK
jgi:hypothetical protein